MFKHIIPLLFLFMSGCDEMTLPSIEYIPTLGDTFTFEVLDPEMDLQIHTSLEGFPKEIHYGDPLYLVFYDENSSNETVNHTTVRPYALNGSISSQSISETYSWTSEYPSIVQREVVLPNKLLLPGENYLSCKHYFEFPPLEDWYEPFWKELREKMVSEGIVCQLQLEYRQDPLGSSGESYMKSVTYDILIKPRPANEIALLEKWYKNTPGKMFPKVDGDRKVPHNMDLKSSGQSDINIGWKSYDLWLFIRIGNCKPSAPNNPATLEGWRELEASLIPSTMRDEVRLTRLQLEYYSAKKGEASDNAKKELVEWLKSLPEVQRTVITTFLVSQMNDFFQTSLRDKNRELMRFLYDILDNGCQETVCDFESINYKDHTLTPPTGTKVRRSITEILEPIEEDIALNSKELPDGFRIWDATGDVGPTRGVGRFVELKEDEDTVIIKVRDGWDINFIFSKLTEEDKQYAREQQEKTLVEEAAE